VGGALIPVIRDEEAHSSSSTLLVGVSKKIIDIFDSSRFEIFAGLQALQRILLVFLQLQ